MTLESVLEALYDSEINFSISCFWDSGIDVKLGDEINGYDAEGHVVTMAEAAEWFDANAHAVYPSSKYATGKDPATEAENGQR